MSAFDTPAGVATRKYFLQGGNEKAKKRQEQFEKKQAELEKDELDLDLERLSLKEEEEPCGVEKSLMQEEFSFVSKYFFSQLQLDWEFSDFCVPKKPPRI